MDLHGPLSCLKEDSTIKIIIHLDRLIFKITQYNVYTITIYDKDIDETTWVFG